MPLVPADSCLDTWSYVDRTLWEMLEGMALLLGVDVEVPPVIPL